MFVPWKGMVKIMRIRFYNARVLTMDGDMGVDWGEVWVEGNRIVYVGDGNELKSDENGGSYEKRPAGHQL